MLVGIVCKRTLIMSTGYFYVKQKAWSSLTINSSQASAKKYKANIKGKLNVLYP